MLIINKGSSFGWSLEELAESKSSLGLAIIINLEAIIKSWEQEDPKTNHLVPPRTKGLVKKAYNGMYHDLHGLSVLIDMINHIYENKSSSTRHKDFLFVSEVVEKYFTNIRSLYDFLAQITLLAVNPRFHGQISSDSLNSLIKAVEKENAKEKFPEDLTKILQEIKPAFSSLKNTRDFITHHGKQLGFQTHPDGYHMENPVNQEEAKVYIPLLPFLQEITLEMMNFSAEVAEIISKNYKGFDEIPYYLIALEGVCIPTFIDFLGILEEEKKED